MAVPNLPGVPPLATYAAGVVTLVTSDAIASLVSRFDPRWGLFQNGIKAITADSVSSFEYKQDWNVSDYPLEAGAFESYDKVSVPFTTRLRFTSGGNEVTRSLLLSSIKKIAGTLELFDAVTPETIYQSVNINHFDYRRTSQNGVGLLVVDVWCLQIKVDAVSAFSNTQAPAGANAASGGTVQPATATAQEAAAAPTVQ